MTKTQTVAGQTLTLEAGIRYRAERPFYHPSRTGYRVTLRKLDTPLGGCRTTRPLSYQQANALVNAFNNGATSFDGRVW